MTLEEYVKKHGRGTIAKISREAAVSYQTIWLLVNRDLNLKLYDVAKRISDATGGQVSIKELCEVQDG